MLCGVLQEEVDYDHLAPAYRGKSKRSKFPPKNFGRGEYMHDTNIAKEGVGVGGI